MNILKKYSIKLLWAAVSKLPIFPKGLRPWDKIGVTKEVLARIYNAVSHWEFDLWLVERQEFQKKLRERRHLKKPPQLNYL